jgi:RNA polymerase sigma-70 factor (ECF subfamily)
LNEADAAEALQEIYILIWLKACKYDDARSSPITWLSTLARNRCLDLLRETKSLTLRHVEAQSELCEEPAVVDVLIAREEQERLVACLGELDKSTQAAIRAAFVRGDTYLAFALKEAVPLGTIKSRIRRGLQALRVRMQA